MSFFKWLFKLLLDQRGVVNPLVIVDAAVPGDADSYYSEQKSLATAGGGAHTVVPEIGWIMAVPVTAVAYTLRTSISPATYATIIAAGGAGLIWSDGTNVFVTKASGGAANALYFVLQHKP